MSHFPSKVGAFRSKHQKVLGWLNIFVRYSSVQALVQVLSFLAGILILRSLPKQDYAYFLIVNTVVPVINLLSDTGITSSLSAIGGRFWQDDSRFGSLIRTALVLRRQLVVISAAAVTPVMVAMLWKAHAPLTQIGWLIAITLVGVGFQLKAGVLGVVISLRQQIQRMQALALWGIVPRIILIGILAWSGLLTAPLAVAAGTVAIAIQFWLLEKWVKPQVTWDALPDSEFRSEILANVKRQAPLTIYFCIQGQLGIWLISIFGNVEGIAEVGALGRIGMIFSILSATTSALVVPRFARSQDPDKVRSIYFNIMGVSLIFLSIGTLLCWWIPGPLLWLLGPKYDQLGDLVWLVVLAAGTSSLAALVYSLNVSKAWIPRASIVLPIAVVSQVLLCFAFDLTTVRGVLLIGVIGPAVPGLVNFALALPHVRNPRNLPLAP